MSFIAERTHAFYESTIRQMTLVCQQYGAINLAQGLPEDDTPEPVKQACIEAIQQGYNQYARTYGIPELAAALAAKMQAFQGLNFEPESQVTVCCGGTEAMMSAFLATLNPGDQVLVPCPYYENYRAELMMAGAEPVFVPMAFAPERGFQLELPALERALGPRTRGLILNTPHNPTGQVLSRSELQQLAAFACAHNLLVYTDETYEHMVYSGEHISPAVLPGMAERTITISSLSKTYVATGWRVAWAIAAPELTEAIRKVHDFLTISAPHPMQRAAAVALALPDSYYAELLARYAARRELLCQGLQAAGFRFAWPAGAYYVLADISQQLQPGERVRDFSLRLIREAGVGTVPGSAFMPGGAEDTPFVRFSFCKQLPTLQAAVERLQGWARA